MIHLNPQNEVVSYEHLVMLLGDLMMGSVPNDVPEETKLNFQQNMNDAMSAMPKLQTGLDVNVGFTKSVFFFSKLMRRIVLEKK